MIKLKSKHIGGTFSKKIKCKCFLLFFFQELGKLLETWNSEASCFLLKALFMESATRYLHGLTVKIEKTQKMSTLVLKLDRVFWSSSARVRLKSRDGLLGFSLLSAK